MSSDLIDENGTHIHSIDSVFLVALHKGALGVEGRDGPNSRQGL